MSERDFNLGRTWGYIEALEWEDAAHSDMARMVVIGALVDAIEQLPEGVARALQEAAVVAYSNWKCHGYLSPETVCADCGAIG